MTTIKPIGKQQTGIDFTLLIYCWKIIQNYIEMTYFENAFYHVLLQTHYC